MARRLASPLLLVACTSGAPDVPAPDAALRLRAPDIEGGTLAQHAVLRLVADRPLEPATVLRQSFAIADLGTGNVLSPPIRYEPTTRTVLVDLDSSGLVLAQPERSYRLRIWSPEDKGVSVWFRGVDGSVLPAATGERSWTFRIVRSERKVAPSPVSFCDEVLPTFRAQCTGCHAGPEAAMGLDLSSPATVAETAVGRAARLSRDTPGLSAGLAPLGTAMQRIAPGNAGSSLLLYKVLLAPSGEESAEDARARRMLDTVIPGAAMGQLTVAQKRTLSAWIAEGAPTPNCP